MKRRDPLTITGGQQFPPIPAAELARIFDDAPPAAEPEPSWFERNLTGLCCLACLAIWMAWAIGEWRLG